MMPESVERTSTCIPHRLLVDFNAQLRKKDNIEPHQRIFNEARRRKHNGSNHKDAWTGSFRN